MENNARKYDNYTFNSRTQDFMSSMPDTRFVDQLRDGFLGPKPNRKKTGGISPIQFPVDVLMQGHEATLTWLKEQRDKLADAVYSAQAGRELRDLKLVQIDEAIKKLISLS